MFMNLKKRIKSKKGFTLIELIVVIAILGILALIAIPRIAGFQETARIKADLANAKTIANQVAIYKTSNTVAAATYTLSNTSSDATVVAIKGVMNGSFPAVQASNRGSGNDNFKLVVDGSSNVQILVGTNELYPDITSGSAWQ